jgi:hypothetical protein
MFRCAVTGKLSKAGEKCNKIVVERREKLYKRDGEVVARGWEIVREISVTEEGLKQYNQVNPHVLVHPAV